MSPFADSADVYDLCYSIKDYAAEARMLRRVLAERRPNATTLLDVACGTGRHIEHLSRWYEVEGIDINEEFLARARRRCPDVPLHRADMTDFDLGRRFDVVTCLFSSIAYIRTRTNFVRAIESMRAHLRSGGVLVIEPFFSPDRFWTGTITANHAQAANMKVAWMYTTKREGDIGVLDIHYLVGTPERVEYGCERLEQGLFPDELYVRTFAQLGLEGEFEEEGLRRRGLYLAFDNDSAQA
jgi:SAM-dependent methyltransferase